MLKMNNFILLGLLYLLILPFVSSVQEDNQNTEKSKENLKAFTQLTNIQTLSKTTALSFLKNKNHRSKRNGDLNIAEECQEDTCFYEEVREYINYKKMDLDVCSWIKRKKCETCRSNYICKTVTADCSSLRSYTIKCVDAKLPTVSARLQDIEGDKDEMKQELYFSCTSEEIENSFQFHFFQFIWLVNGNVSFTSEIVHRTNLSNGYFYERNGFHQLGVEVACQYVAFKSLEDNGSISKVSDNFFAGIKVLNEPVTVERGKMGEILLQLTVPFGCYIYYEGDKMKTAPCPLNVELKTIQKLDCGGINTQNLCGTKFQNGNWNAVKRLFVQHTNDLNYQVPMYQVKLTTLPMESHPIWSNVEIPNVKINVKEKFSKWQGKSCYSHSDPHMMTFDGVTYDNQNAGTFIMYEGRDGHDNIMQVQTKLTPCNKLAGPGIFCNCGVAIRAASDIYVINRCPDDELFFGFKHCADDVLDIKKQDDFNYIIYFPTSTYIHLRLWTFQTENVIEVNIFPSIFDEEFSKGLCNKLGSHGRFFDANGTTNVLENFIDSWRVADDENLFLVKNFDDIKFKPMHITSSPLCSCLEVQGVVKYSETITCGKQMNCSKPDHPIYNKKICHVKSKRSARSLFSYVPRKMKQTLNRRKRSVHATTMISSKDEARAFCERYMKASRAFQACRNVPSIDASKATASCILDITLTNSTLWAPASREGFKELCKKELRQNNTLRESEEGKFMIDHINNIMCPNECSGHGECINGTCECVNEFGGSDCSQDLSIAPDVFSVNPDSSGLCDASDCEDVIVEGDMFLRGDGLLCKMKKFQASVSNARIFHETIYTPAEHNTLTEVRCRLPKTKPKRSTVQEARNFVTGFEVSVSNNAKDYSTGHLVYILDSTCQDTTSVSGELRFTLKNNYCFINGECIPDAAEYGMNNCYVCNTKSNVFVWSLNSTKNGCEQFARKDEHQYPIFMIPTLCGFLLILIITTALILRKMKNKGLKIEDFAIQPPPYTDAAKPTLYPRKLEWNN